MTPILGLLAFCFACVVAILAIIFLVVPLFKGLGWAIGGIFTGIGWLIRHVFEFVAGMLTDVVRFVGAIIAWVVLLPLMLLNVVIGRWSASGHYYRSMKRECGVGASCLYRVVLQRPLRFLLLGGLLEGLEQRVNEAVDAAPTSDRPGRRTGTFDGYTIVGSLPGGGSGAKLYIARPDAKRRAKPGMPDRVVIKSFALTDGSTLPQIVRESRALEAAKQLGLVLEHGMDHRRFFYIMPYHHGDHLGIVTRQLHGRSDGRGLDRRHLDTALGHVEDLLHTLSRYHEGGLWHKDVKPDNVIIHDGRAHLVDLGLVTPLRSAMTLTTHGTEYFRDPEMVRMALKGVKVHQVDGAKFDIYAAGAVLYFVLENTFPAHGGLSAFAKESPEATRWIVRRAMADYNKRYETASAMLADLAFVRAAADPFEVKPAQLPSMRGVTPPEADVPDVAVTPEPARPMPEPVVVAAAGSPRPPAAQPAGVVGADPRVAAPRRPRIRVTNWWTGAYEVEDARAEAVADRAEARTFRDQVRGLRAQGEAFRRQVHHGRAGARRAAREQIKAARERARQMQRRVREHRRQARSVLRDHEPMATGLMQFLAVAVLVGGGLIAAAVWRSNDEPRNTVSSQFVFDDGPAVTVQPALARPMTLLMVNDHPAPTNSKVKARIEGIVQSYLDQGWSIVFDDADAEVEVRKHLPAGDDGEVSPLLENTLREHHLGGVIRIRSSPGDAPLDERVSVGTIVLEK